MEKSFYWDHKENTIRGSFVNLAITFVYLILVVLSVFSHSIAQNVREVESFLVGFFVTSFGIWTGSKSVEMWKTKSMQVMPKKPCKDDEKQNQHTVNSEND